jgi:hypothetical protein
MNRRGPKIIAALLTTAVVLGPAAQRLEGG